MEIWREHELAIVKVDYNPEIVKNLHEMGGGKWDRKRRVWIFPRSRMSTLMALKAKYEREMGKKKIDDHQLKVGGYIPKAYKSKAVNGSDLSKMKAYMTQAGYSPTTRTNYLNHIKRFLEFSNNSLDEREINAYMVSLLEVKKCSHAYCNQAINAIKLYLKHLGLGSEDILALVRPKKEKKLPKVLSKSEVKRILEVTENTKHKLALTLGYSCGMRVSEVANLKLEDIHIERMVIHIKQSKGRKDRIVPLSKKLVDLYVIYLDQYRPYIWVFENPTRDGSISPRTLQNVFNQSKSKAKVYQPSSFHSLRHSYATHLMESGVDLRIIQELLGHASSKTTEVYTHVSNVSLLNIINPLDDMD